MLNKFTIVAAALVAAIALFMSAFALPARADFNVPAGSDFSIQCGSSTVNVQWMMRNGDCEVIFNDKDLADLAVKASNGEKGEFFTPAVFKTRDGQIKTVEIVSVDISNKKMYVRPWDKKGVCSLNLKAPKAHQLRARGWNLEKLRTLSGCKE